MNNCKHAYWLDKNGDPCYTVFTSPTDELVGVIKNKNAIVMDKQHDFIMKFDPNLEFLPAYKFDFDNNTISIDMDIAKLIVIDTIKRRRNNILKQLDTEQLKCMTNPDKLARLESVKQQLRDLPILILESMVGIDNLTDLRHISPPILTTYKETI